MCFTLQGQVSGLGPSPLGQNLNGTIPLNGTAIVSYEEQVIAPGGNFCDGTPVPGSQNSIALKCNDF
jgi:hypothetical protein